jgi:hypothetical protein
MYCHFEGVLKALVQSLSEARQKAVRHSCCVCLLHALQYWPLPTLDAVGRLVEKALLPAATDAAVEVRAEDTTTPAPSPCAHRPCPPIMIRWQVRALARQCLVQYCLGFPEASSRVHAALDEPTRKLLKKETAEAQQTPAEQRHVLTHAARSTTAKGSAALAVQRSSSSRPGSRPASRPASRAPNAEGGEGVPSQHPQQSKRQQRTHGAAAAAAEGKRLQQPPTIAPPLAPIPSSNELTVDQPTGGGGGSLLVSERALASRQQPPPPIRLPSNSHDEPAVLCTSAVGNSYDSAESVPTARTVPALSTAFMHSSHPRLTQCTPSPRRSCTLFSPRRAPVRGLLPHMAGRSRRRWPPPCATSTPSRRGCARASPSVPGASIKAAPTLWAGRRPRPPPPRLRQAARSRRGGPRSRRRPTRNARSYLYARSRRRHRREQEEARPQFRTRRPRAPPPRLAVPAPSSARVRASLSSMQRKMS